MRCREGNHLSGCVEQILRLQFPAVIAECGKHGIVDQRLQFGTDEPLGCRCDGAKVEPLREHGIAALPEMDFKYFYPLAMGRKIEKKDLIKPAFAQEFRGKASDVVGGGEDEYRSGFFLHPGKKGGKDPACRAAVAHRASKGFFYFVNPEHAGSDNLGNTDRFANILFARTKQAAEDSADIHSQQRHPPVPCGYFCTEAFSGSGDPDESHPLRHTEAILARILAERLLALIEPCLQSPKSADVVHGTGIGVEFESAAFTDDVPFFVQHLPDAPFVEPMASGNHNGFAKGPSRFDDGETECAFDQSVRASRAWRCRAPGSSGLNQ